MANLSTSGLEELIGGFDAIAEIPDEVVLEMLVAEAEVIAPAQEAEARAMLSGKYRRDGAKHFLRQEAQENIGRTSYLRLPERHSATRQQAPRRRGRFCGRVR